MKKICLLLVFVFYLSIISMSQCPEDLFIWSQEQIDNFQEDYPGCTEIDGMVDITGSEVKNLEGLSVLTSISGSFTIWLADSVESLEGLNNLQYVGGDFSLYENDRLSDITALESLEYIGGGLYFRFNTQLTSLKGLNNLDSIGNDFYLRNSAVTNFEGLESLQKVGADFWIHNNPELIDFSGLNMLEEIQGEVRVNSNNSVINFSGLGSLKIVHGSFIVGGIFNYNEGNPSLVNLKGLEKLVNINGFVQIESNDALVNLEGLNSLDFIYGNLIIEYNKRLIELSGLESLTSVYSLGISYNDTLQTLEGLSTNLDIYNTLVVQSNPYLSTCEVKSICNHLDLSFDDTFINGNAVGCATKDEVAEACEVESINENQQMFFEIYPNPSADFIAINLTSENDYQYKIFNTLGKLIVKGDLFDTKSINISELPAGTYIIELSNDKKTARRAFIKK